MIPEIPEKVVAGLFSIIPDVLIDAGLGPGVWETIQDPSRPLADKIVAASVLIGINVLIPLLIVFGKEINDREFPGGRRIRE